MCYPQKLLPQQDDVIITAQDIVDYCLVRETSNNFYSKEFLDIPESAKAKMLVGENTSRTDVFELSLYLFGEYNLDTVGIRVDDAELEVFWDPGSAVPKVKDIPFHKINSFPVFLSAGALYDYKCTIDGDETRETVVVQSSYEHRPTIVNYWHFQLFSVENNKRLSRDLNSRKAKRIAKSLLETILKKAMLSKDKVSEYHRQAG